jgi:peptidyl-prolyl cis-trans isomerase C
MGKIRSGVRGSRGKERMGMVRMRVGATLITGVLVAMTFGIGCQKGTKDKQAEGPLTGDPKTVVAKVEGREIRLEEVNKIVQMWKTGGMQIPGVTTERDFQTKALDNIIDRQLLLLAAQKGHMVPDSLEVNQQFQQFEQRFGTPEKFQGWLTAQGMTEAQARTEIATDLSVQKFIVAQVPDTAKVTSDQAHAYYDAHPDMFTPGEQVHARHILVKVDPNATPDQKAAARRKAERLLTRVKGGEDFATVAKDSSDDASASRGGDLGEFGRGQMVAPFDAAVFQLQPGQISDVVETQFGYHIIKCEERKEAKIVPYDDKVEAYAMRQVQQERRNDSFKKVLEGLHVGAKIKRKL